MDAVGDALVALRGRAPEDAVSLAHLRELQRSFFGPLLTPGPRRIAADEGLGARDVIRDKRAIIGLRLPGRMLSYSACALGCMRCCRGCSRGRPCGP